VIKKMSDQSPQIKREIEILEERLAKLREATASPEAGAQISDKELLREAVADRIREAVHLPPSPVPPVPPSPIPSAPPLVLSRRQPHDEVKEVEEFVAMAFSQSIPVAVKAVMKSGNAHLIDALHDVLVDRFYEELVRLGKLK
jgi:hypothetical protein